MKKAPKWLWAILVITIIIFLFSIASLILSSTPNLLTFERGIGMHNLVGVAQNDSDLPVLSDSMPPFLGITKWWNSDQPLSPEDLKGKVVLVDFWTYSCINCIRTQPVLRAWWDKYKDSNFVIIGVHTPEFAFEKEEGNVSQAIKDAMLDFPIANDPDYKTWQAYNNHYWPASYLFDAQGRLRYTHFGEGEYDHTEKAIRSLINETENLPFSVNLTNVDTTPNFLLTKTAETYFGYKRMESFANQDELANNEPKKYTLKNVLPNQWSIGGTWQVEDERAFSININNEFQMNAQSNAMHIVLGATNQPAHLKVLIDDRNPTDAELTQDTTRLPDGSVIITVTQKDLYRIARFPDAERHTVKLQALDPNIEFYAATFGE